MDLMKLLGLENSFAARKELAVELGCPSEKMGDSAKMNMWLHKTVLQKLADKGGNIPQELLGLTHAFVPRVPHVAVVGEAPHTSVNWKIGSKGGLTARLQIYLPDMAAEATSSALLSLAVGVNNIPSAPHLHERGIQQHWHQVQVGRVGLGLSL